MEENNVNLSEEEEVEELSFTDKVVGVFAEPGKMFGALYPNNVKVTDWLIPIVLVIIAVNGMSFLIMNDANLKNQVIEKQMTRIEENFEKAIDAGQLTEEQAEQRLGMIREQMDTQMTAGLMIQSVIVTAAIFILFFVISGFYFLIVKFGLKGEASYNAGLSVYGLPTIISILQVIVMLIVTFLTGKLVSDLNLAG